MQLDRYWNSVAIFAGPSPATGTMASGSINQLIRCKSYSDNVNVTRQDVNVLGKLGRLDAIIVDPPTVSLTVTTDDVNALNLQSLGGIVDGSVSFASGMINGTTDDRNMFVLWTSCNEDAIGTTEADGDFAV